MGKYALIPRNKNEMQKKNKKKIKINSSQQTESKNSLSTARAYDQYVQQLL